ncbi:MAG TPA: hypothetical protein VN781_02630 [Acidimicrobiales bacterium]|nr:hypothetical protein [Acidimicrobiales bacterium]
MADQRNGDASPGGRLGADWPAKAADLVELAVDNVFDRVVRPAVVAVRAVVFGLLIGAAGTVALLAISIAFVRLLDVYAFGGRVWASDALVGAVLSAAGLFAWSRRAARPTGDEH